MKILLLGVGVYASLCFGSSELKTGKITKITDGDTVWVEVKGETLKVRMLGMDAPEEHIAVKDKGMIGQDPWGQRASTYLKKLLPLGTKVTLEDEGLDMYKRTLGRIFKDNVDINLEMIRKGWAIPYIICEGRTCTPRFFKTEHAEEYLEACDEARENKAGIFGTNKPLKEMPFEFRLRVQKRQANKYVGDFVTSKAVNPENYKAVDLCNRVFFMKKSDVRNAGFEFK